MIGTELRDHTAILTIDRHEKRNALDTDHLNELTDAVQKSVGEGCRSLVITGAGSSFCAGADLGGVYGDGFRSALYRALTAIMAAPVPVIAAVNGPAIGAGTQLAIACDLRVAAPGARFAVPTARNGLAVDPWTIRRLSVIAGGATARALLLACETIGSELAVTRGLADRIGTFDDAIELAAQIASFAPLSLSYSKRALESLLEPRPWASDLDEDFERCWASEDFKEGRIAHSQGRPPTFVGR